MIKDLIRRVRVHAIRTTMGGREMPSPKVCVVVAPHPDDEVLGCCALMRRLIAEGKRVELVLMTGGGKSHAGCCDIDERELVSQRRRLTLSAAAVYGLDEAHIHFLDYPDGGIRMEHPETRRLEELMRRLTLGEQDVAVLYPHLRGEGWPDHITTGRIAARICGEVCPGARQYEYCVWFWFYNCWHFDRHAAYTVRMSREEHATKLRAISEYIEPKAPCGKPWSGVLPQNLLNGTPLTLVFPAQFRKGKRQEMLVEALRLYVEKTGDGSIKMYLPGDGLLRESVMQMVEDWGLKENILFPGKLPLHDILGLYERCNIALVSSNVETYGRCIAEPFMLGRCLLTQKTGVALDIIRNGKNGMFFTDAENLASILEQLHNHPEHVVAMGQQAFEDRKVFFRDAVMQSYLNVIRKA